MENRNYENWGKTEIMKIGNHIGKRAQLNTDLGYFFETIIDMSDHKLFVYDRKIGHSASLYFDNNKHEWNDELRQRCWFVRPEYVTIERPKIIL